MKPIIGPFEGNVMLSDAKMNPLKLLDPNKLFEYLSLNWKRLFEFEGKHSHFVQHNYVSKCISIFKDQSKLT